jgi:ABC-type uncharacterized transport system permease subunit
VNSNIWILSLAGSIEIATTLILAALGALFTERAGVLNLGIEGMLLTSAITSFLVADASGRNHIYSVGTNANASVSRHSDCSHRTQSARQQKCSRCTKGSRNSIRSGRTLEK